MSKISELSDGGVIQGGDTLIAVRSGGNVKVTYGGSTTANIDGGSIDGTTIGGTTPAAGNFTTGSFTGNVSFGDNDKAIFGAGNDLQIYHDGSNSYISEVGTGELVIQARDAVTIEDGTSGDNYVYMQRGNKVSLFYSGAEKLATTSTGIDVTGDITLGDTNPTITFNDSSVTNLSHTILSASDNLRITADVNGVDSGSRVEIFDGTTEVARFEAGAVDVTGTVTADGLTVDGDASINRATLSDTASDPALEISARTDSSNLDFKFTDTDGSVVVDQVHHKSEYYATDGTQVSAKVRTEYADVSGGMNYVISTSGAGVAVRDRLKIGSNGDISFYEDTGTTAKLFWDASAESLGIGTSNVLTTLHTVTSAVSGTARDTNAVALFDAVEGRIQVRANDTGSDGAVVGLSTGSHNWGLLATATSKSNNFVIGYQDTSTDGNVFGADTLSNHFVITTSGNVGIGTSPSAPLHVGKSGAAAELWLQRTDGYNPVKLFGSTLGDGQGFKINVNSNDAFAIDSSGQVGIGVTPSNWGSSANRVLQIRESGFFQQDNVTNVGFGRNAFQSGAWSYIADGYAQMLNLESDGAFKFFQAGSGTAGNTVSFSQAMTLDASGNLLVGKTGTSFSTAGSRLTPDGGGQFIVNEAACIEVNRLSNDGTLVGLYKDGSAVGSIQSRAGVVSTIILDPRSGQGAGLTGAGAGGDTLRHITPTNESGTEVNGKVSLGNSNNGFKDLYLLGGAYLGGTGSANYLDDYEEGTWTGGTLVLSNCSSVTTANLTYTKIGRLVTLQGNFNLTVTSATTEVRITFTLPFSQYDADSPATGSAFANFGSNDNSRILGAVVNTTGSNATQYTVVFPSADVESGSGKLIQFGLTYEAA